MTTLFSWRSTRHLDGVKSLLTGAVLSLSVTACLSACVTGNAGEDRAMDVDADLRAPVAVRLSASGEKTMRLRFQDVGVDEDGPGQRPLSPAQQRVALDAVARALAGVDDELTREGFNGPPAPAAVGEAPEAGEAGEAGEAAESVGDVVVYGHVVSFVRATGQTSAGGRAWTTPTTIHLLRPALWDRHDDDDIRRRLVHERCHQRLWQRAAASSASLASSVSSVARGPRAVEEGLCSVVARQGDLRGERAAVVDELEGGRVVDFNEDSAFAYAVAHHVVATLDGCLGRQGVLTAYDDLVAGADFGSRFGSPLAILRASDCGGILPTSSP